MPLQDAVHLEIGRSTEFAFVFSCPGRCESEARPPGPAKGATGTNLDELVQQLDPNRQLPLRHRGQARITNAWDQVEYVRTRRPRAGRTEPDLHEVLEHGNLSRLSEELRDISRAIICCGTMAAAAVCRIAALGELHNGVRIAVAPHLGQQRLNSMFSIWACDTIQPPPATEVSSVSGPRRRRLRVSLAADWLRAQAPEIFQ